MKLNEGLDVCSEDIWYDLCEGYLDPYEICEDDADAARVEDAIAVLKEFQESCETQIDGFYK